MLHLFKLHFAEELHLKMLLLLLLLIHADRMAPENDGTSWKLKER